MRTCPLVVSVSNHEPGARPSTGSGRAIRTYRSWGACRTTSPALVLRQAQDERYVHTARGERVEPRARRSSFDGLRTSDAYMPARGERVERRARRSSFDRLRTSDTYMPLVVSVSNHEPGARPSTGSGRAMRTYRSWGACRTTSPAFVLRQAQDDRCVHAARGERVEPRARRSSFDRLRTSDAYIPLVVSVSNHEPGARPSTGSGRAMRTCPLMGSVSNHEPGARPSTGSGRAMRTCRSW